MHKKENFGTDTRSKSMIVPSNKRIPAVRDLPLAVTNAVGDFLRTTAETTDLTVIYEVIKIC